jgi:PTS system fructose-specific IIA component/PTS system nitrogen regulatory IIA component
MVATVAVSKKKLDFQSIDRSPVDIIFLLVSPPDRPGDHLRALQLISQHLREEIFCRFLRQSATPEAVAEILQEADEGKLL